MTGNAKTRRPDCGAAVDRISNLPRNLMNLILDRLPVDDVARTSILSKAWRDVWIMHPKLVFNDQFISQLVSKKVPLEDIPVQLSEVSRTISNILLVHSRPILTFHLTIPSDLPLHQSVDFWIKNISTNGVWTLELLNRKPFAYKIPSCLFSCSELTHLRLVKCILNPPLKFEGFCNLIDVTLVSVIITADMSLGTQLKQLTVDRCVGVEHLGSRFKNYNNLTELIIADSREIDWRLFECIPRMQLSTLGLMGKVTTVISLDKLVGNMPRINKIHLDGFFLESLELDAAILKRPITTMESLNFECVGLENLVQILNILCLIRSSPNLRCLRIVPETELFSSDDMDSLDPSVLSVDMILHQLETVEILNMIGAIAELQFVKLLLASAPSLKWITTSEFRRTTSQFMEFIFPEKSWRFYESCCSSLEHPQLHR